MSEWQPIETAPRDATAILIYWPHWHHFPLVAYVQNFQWELVNSTIPYHRCHVDDGPHSPTHWMPLPEPPATLTRKEDE